MIKNKRSKCRFRRHAALLLTGALLAGLLPVGLGTGVESRAAEQPALRNPRILKTTQEMAPGTGGKKELKNPTMENGITTWDCIWFGNYWQEDTNGDGKADKNDEKTPIKWRVLSVEGDDVFLLADKNLDVQRYNNSQTDNTWETCTVRSWLNGYGAEKNKEGIDYSENNFLGNAFSAGEQSAIQTTTVVNNENSVSGAMSGNDTADQIFLLSINEAEKREYGFTASIRERTNTRQVVNTTYAAHTGEWIRSAGNVAGWWLRSPGEDDISVSNVNAYGYYWYSWELNRDYVGVRPALHLNLSAASEWSYAGTVPSDKMAEWDCIWFGNYWQEDTNGDGKADENDEKTPIKWRVLSVEGDDVFLLADKSLDYQKYNNTDANVTWETCTMRSWLNGYGAEKNEDGTDYSENNFLDNAFSVTEQSAIQTTAVVNDDNSQYGTEGGNDTTDQVYLLSIDEVTNPEYGFISFDGGTNTRRAVNTAYIESIVDSTDWWLRSPGYNSNYSSFVYRGHTDSSGSNASSSGIATRPALHLNLSSDSGWSYAGTVTSDEKAEDPETPIPSQSPAPSEPENTQKPQETAVPSRPVVIPSVQQPGFSVTQQPGISPDPEKAAPGKVSALKLRQKKRTVTASWKKITGAKGYQICYSTSKKWKSKKQKLAAQNKAVIKNLQKKKTYYFRVRAYRMDGTKKVYGAWSGVKKIQINK